MAAYFIDSSALVKAYIIETGTVWMRSIVDDEDNVVHIASLTQVEIISAFTRRFRRGDITQAEIDAACDESQLDIANQFEIVQVTDLVIKEAANLAKSRGLRAYDADQLAAALDTKGLVTQATEDQSMELILLSADIDLNAAAAAEGLKVKDPNNH